MCRYGFKTYKSHYACFACRKVFRVRPEDEWVVRPTGGPVPVVKCADCAAPAVNIGKDFKAPPRRRVKEWRRLAVLHRAGFRFHTCGCNGPGPVPRTRHEVAAYAGPVLARSLRVRIRAKRRA